MEHLDIITICFLGLAILSVALGIWAAIAFTRPVSRDEYLNDDAPARYEEFEECFYNP